jgi:hypothetical protein
MPDELLQVAVFSGIVVVGLLWARGSLRRWSEYSFAEDLKSSFLRERWRDSSDSDDGGPQLIAPVMVVIMGLALFVSLVVRRLSE